ncbi:MAG: sulfatase-like hydrolase/transferase [Bradymonadia bacterium]
MSAVFLGAGEAIHLAITAGPQINVFERFLAALYILSPFVLIGLLLGFTVTSLAEVWRRTRRVTFSGDRYTNWTTDALAASLVTLLVTVGLFLLSSAVLNSGGSRTQVAGILTVATPAAIGLALYGWAILRAQLMRLERRFGSGLIFILIIVLLAGGAAVPTLIILQNDALREFLGEWTAAYLVLYPLTAALLTTTLNHWAVGRPKRLTSRRWIIIGALIGAAGTTDLVFNLDRNQAVKKVLLANTLVFQPLIMTVQPLFDRDGDGYAGLLGGGDCNDADPEIHPGATERPRNGLDDDCFEGDSPGQTRPEIVLPAPLKPAASRGLIERPNIILITLDTIRADHLGYHGYKRPTSPALDKLAESGIQFLWAFAQGPQTRLSVPSMFTGRYYSEVARTPDTWSKIHGSNVLLAERLKAAGYLTAGIPSHRFFLPHYGLHQGFEQWDLSIVEKFQQKVAYRKTGQFVTERAAKWLREYDSEGRPFFLWLHYFDAHFAYLPHPQYDFGDSPFDRYDAEIRYTDEQVGRLLKALSQSPLAADTYVIIQSDHGEGFGDHGYQYHGQELFNDQVHVPLLIAGPGIKARQVMTPVSLLDVVPTVLDFAGVPIPTELPGRSLVPYGTADVSPPRTPVYIEMLKDATHSERRVIVDWPWKLHYSITFNEYRLFDLSQDPQEEKDVVDQHPEVFQRLQRRLRRWMAEEVKPIKASRQDPGRIDTEEP